MDYNILCLFTCYNRLIKTAACIESLRVNKYCNFEFIIVDDNSSDGTCEYLKSLEYVKYIHGDGNLYYSGGMHIAMDVAQKRLREDSIWDYILLVNDDVSFYDQSILKMINISQEKFVVVGSTDDGHGNYTYGGVVKKSQWRPKFNHVMDKERLLECDTFNANCVLLPREIFEHVPIMDNYYQHSLGDYDYGFSITKMGYVILATNFFVGLCADDHEIEGSWLDKSLTIRKRIKLKESIRGVPFRKWFYFVWKNYNLLSGIIFSITPYMKIVFRLR